MVDACFAEPRLAALYDAFEGSREDLAFYSAIALELGAASVIDLGCGTGTFACVLAEQGHAVTGIDPAEASVALAQAKPFADRVRWIVGEIADYQGPVVDLLTMTGNVAQVFVSDTAWSAALRWCRMAVRMGGWIVFETRDPRRQAWRHWIPEETTKRVFVPGVGRVEARCELTQVEFPFVSFRWTYTFAQDGTTMRSDSTLRFRERDELCAALAEADFEVTDVRDAPDRPGAEMVFIAQAT